MTDTEIIDYFEEHVEWITRFGCGSDDYWYELHANDNSQVIKGYSFRDVIIQLKNKMECNNVATVE